jgi:hypothetical protein
MDILSSCEMSRCHSGWEYQNCTCYKQNEAIAEYEGGPHMFKTVMCWHFCCKEDGGDRYSWGGFNDGLCEQQTVARVDPY